MTKMDSQLAGWAEYAYQVARQAGDVIMQHYQQLEAMIPDFKPDSSPVTKADKDAHQVIHGLLSQYPLNHLGVVPVFSEEGLEVPFVERQTWPWYWCVDPLDGTREFLARNDEFSVNIALMENNEPVIGVVYGPVKKEGFCAWRGGGAYRVNAENQFQRVVAQSPIPSPIRILVSRHSAVAQVHGVIARLGEAIIAHEGSAMKYGRIASGEADILLRLAPTSEWDNAAGHCIVEESGGRLMHLDGTPLRYNCSGSVAQNRFIAVGDREFPWKKFL